MSTPEHQEKLKEEAKGIRTRLETLIKDKDPKARMVRTVCIYAGLLTETLLEYEEPDVVMEQAFHRVADLLRTDSAEGEETDTLLPLAYTIDHDTELGRQLGREQQGGGQRSSSSRSLAIARAVEALSAADSATTTPRRPSRIPRLTR